MYKPTVLYEEVPGLTHIQIGHSATVIPLDHPDSGDLFRGLEDGEVAFTSPVIGIRRDGFETRNTIYKRKG